VISFTFRSDILALTDYCFDILAEAHRVAIRNGFLDRHLQFSILTLSLTILPRTFLEEALSFFGFARESFSLAIIEDLSPMIFPLIHAMTHG